MAEIKSGVDATLLTIDTTGAMRSTLYNSSGVELNPVPTGIYMLPVDIRFSAILTAGTTAAVWAMRVDTSATKNIYIRKIYLRSGFDGTEAASSIDFQLIKFTNATPTGGTSITPPISMWSSMPSTNVMDARVCTGAALLTTTSVTVNSNGHFAAMWQPARNGSNGELIIGFSSPNDPYGTLKLGQGDGLLIRLNPNNTVVGDTLSGYVLWEER